MPQRLTHIGHIDEWHLVVAKVVRKITFGLPSWFSGKALVLGSPFSEARFAPIGSVSEAMDVLRCKTPELVRKEIWTHVLAYNPIRTIMAQAATKHGIEPRSISFKGAVQTLEAFQPVIAIQGRHGSTLRGCLYRRHQSADFALP